MLFDEKTVTSALARVCTEEGVTRGTAFFVLPGGVALTCHHVVESDSKVILECTDGKSRTGMIHDDDRFPEFDLAIIRSDNGDPPGVLPIEGNRKGVSQFWTKGFQFQGEEITDALPAMGTISGDTHVQFSTYNHNYDLDGVLALKEDQFDGGLSGAPVIDPETGVAFAMVNAKFNSSGPLAGFALPFNRFSTRSPRLSDLLVQNRRTIARYGRFLNHLGATLACQQQTSAVIQHLIGNELFLPDQYCDRELEEDLAGFLASEARVLPIVGNAGVGKTTLLAQMAKTCKRSTVFLLARDFSVNEPDLRAAVTSHLQKAIDENFGNDGASSVVAALHEEGSSLLILLDGLNEIPIPISNLKSWFEHSISWLMQDQIRLVFSVRPEFWQKWSSEFPNRLLYQPVIKGEQMEPKEGEEKKEQQRRNQKFLELTDFSHNETLAAMNRYGLKFPKTRAPIRHPLFMRLLWELQDDDDQKLLTMDAVLERFVQRKCQQVAQSLTGTVSTAFVEHGVQKIARRALHSESQTVSWEQFFDGITADIGQQLIDEGLFVHTETGVRFAFDAVGEFVQGQLLNALELKAYLRHEDGYEIALPPAVTAYTLARLEKEGKQGDVAEAVNSLLADHLEDRDRLWVEATLANLLPMLAEPALYFKNLEPLAQQMASRSGPFGVFDRFNLQQAVTATNLHTDVKLRFLLPFMLNEKGYTYELKHWQELSREIRGTPARNIAASLSRFIIDNPQDAFDSLIDHLGDNTMLSDGQVSIGEAISTVLFVHRKLAYGYLCETLARSQFRNAEILLGQIAETEPLELLVLCAGWVQGDDQLLKQRAAKCAFYIAGQFDESTEDLVFEVLKHFLNSKDAELENLADIGIGRLKKYQRGIVPKLIKRMESGDPAVKGFIVGEWTSSYLDEIVAAVTRMLENGGQPKRCCEAIFALSRTKGTPEKRDRVIDLLVLGQKKGLIRWPTFRFAIEYVLMHVDSDEQQQRLYQLAEKIAGIQEGREPLGMFALNPYEKSSYAANLQDSILDLLIENETDRDQLIKLLLRIASSCMDRRDPLQFILKIANKLSNPDLLHECLIYAAYTKRSFGEQLLLWLKSDPRLMPHGETQELIEKVNAGTDLETALNAICSE